MNEWMKLAQDVASWSRCTKKQVGAVVVKDDVLCGIGNNDTILQDGECLQKQEEDYESCEFCGQLHHAEESAIINCTENAAPTKGATLYLYGHTHACENCVDLMELYGIKRLVIG